MNLKWILDVTAVLTGSYELWIPLDYNNINTGIPEHDSICLTNV